MKLKLCLMITFLFVGWLGSVISQDLCEDPEPSARLLSYALMSNGLYVAGNPRDSQSPSAEEDLIFSSLRPVDIPVLQPGITFYFAFSLTALQSDARLVRLTDTDDGLIKNEMYKFSDPSKFVPGTFEIANLTALRESDIDLNSDPCVILFKERRNGNFAEVSRTSNCFGFNEVEVLLRCNALITKFKAGGKIRRGRYGDRYQLPPTLEEKARNFNFRCRN